MRPSSMTTRETVESKNLTHLVAYSVKVSTDLHMNIPSRMN